MKRTPSTSATSRSTMASDPALPGTLLSVRSGAGEGCLRLVLATYEGSAIYPVSEAFYQSLGSPAADTLLSDDEIDKITAHAAYRRALASALSSLAAGDLSRRDLYLKLRRKGHSDQAASAAVAEVLRLGYLREDDAAERLCARCAAKGWSRKKTYAYLASRGYGASIISRAISACEDAGEADFDANRAEMRRKLEERGLSPDEVRRALWRAGF